MNKLLCLAAFAFTLTGCKLLDKAYTPTTTTLPPVTNSVVVWTTNNVVVPASTNAAGVITPPSVTQTATPTTNSVVSPGKTVTTLEENPNVTSGIGLIGSLPVPYAGLIATVLGGAYAMYRNIRNKKALVAVVQGVDTFRKSLQTPELQPLDAKLKQTLIDHQDIAGVLNVVSGVVNDYTGSTTTKIVPASSTVTPTAKT